MLTITMAPLVSVIIPTYNRLPFLQDAVASVRAQTCKDFELIVVDDGSTDRTHAWLERESVRAIALDRAGFPGRTRNAGARAARGDYLAFLDSDDIWMPEKLEHQVAFFREHPDIRICHTREVWRRNGTIVSQSGQRHRREGDIFEDALKKCVIGPSTVMLSKILFESVHEFAEDLEIAEDYELWLHITAREKVGYIDVPLVEKRGGHSDQLSEKYGHIESFRIRALERALARGSFTKKQQDMLRRELARKCLIHARGAEKRGKSKEAAEYRRRARACTE